MTVEKKIGHLQHTASGFSPCIMSSCAASEGHIFPRRSYSHSKAITVIRHLGERWSLRTPRCVYSAESSQNRPRVNFAA